LTAREDLTAGLIGAAYDAGAAQLAANRIFLFQFVIFDSERSCRMDKQIQYSGTDPPHCRLHKVEQLFLSRSTKFCKNRNFAQKVLTSVR
jgi:hypothetical protein